MHPCLNWINRRRGALVALAVVAALSACSSRPPAPMAPSTSDRAAEYLIGPGDVLQVFVWRNPELTVSVPVRPDGKISTPLIEDMQAAGKRPTQLARDVEEKLKTFLQEPIVTVMVSNFVGPFAQQVRVIGEAAQPQAVQYRENMSLLDVMIQVGGLTKFAAGDRAIIVRKVEGKDVEYGVNINRLIKEGDVSANVPLLAGDVIIIPQSWF